MSQPDPARIASRLLEGSGASLKEQGSVGSAAYNPY